MPACMKSDFPRPARQTSEARAFPLGPLLRRARSEDNGRVPSPEGYTMVSPLGHGLNFAVLSTSDLTRPSIDTSTPLGRFYAEHLDESAARLTG